MRRPPQPDRPPWPSREVPLIDDVADDGVREGLLDALEHLADGVLPERTELVAPIRVHFDRHQRPRWFHGPGWRRVRVSFPRG